MADLTILYDGGCPLCRREVTMLERRDQQRHGDQRRLAFVAVDPADYDPSAHGGVTYREAMGRIHGLTAEGEVLRDLPVFRRAYELVGLGWIYAPTRWPLVGSLAAAAYDLWARLRLRLTGRPSLDQLCAARGQSCGLAARPAQPAAVAARPAGG
jgi:predicted DCC family thiol-disulfide oxidoreductase YuxK